LRFLVIALANKITKNADSAHKKTDKELAKLEKRIRSVYKKAYEDMNQTVSDYFLEFKADDEAQLQRLENDEITKKQYNDWRIREMAQGRRFVAMRDALAERMTNANEIAIGYINDDMAKIYALNQAFTVTDIIKQSQATKTKNNRLVQENWILYDERTVKRLLKEQPDIMPYYPKWKAVKRGFDLDFGKRKITAHVTSGILKGSDVNQIATELMDSVTTMSQTSAIRAARTGITEAENAGRMAGMQQLAEKGAILEKRWIATHDARTRPEHAEADGQRVNQDEPFIVGGEKLMYPADDKLGASAWNVYNCRCSVAAEFIGFKKLD
jgi:hypothetical protein